MFNFIALFLLALASMAVGYWFGASSAIEYADEWKELRNQESLPDHANTEPEVVFSYCRPNDVREAFKVSEGVLPKWAFAPNIDVMISPEFKVIVHKENGYNVIATSRDYLVKDSDGDLFACPVDMFEANYVQIATPPTQDD